MSIDNKRKKPSLKATLAGGMKSLIDEVDAKDVKAQEEVVAQNSVSDELEHENNSFNNASDQEEKDFDNVLEYYKRKKIKLDTIYVDAELKQALARLCSTNHFQGCKMSVMTSAILKDFMNRNFDLIKKAIEEDSKLFLSK